jgi:hypothetical protein
MGFAAAALLFMQEPTAKTAVLIAVMVWFFAVFIISRREKRFAGVREALRYLLIQNRRE